MPTFSLPRSVVLAALLGLGATASHASLVGQTVGVTLDFPVQGNVRQNLGTQLITSQGVSFSLLNGNFSIDVFGSDVSVVFNSTFTFPFQDFFGPVLTFSGNIGTVTSSVTVGGFSPNNVSQTDHSFALNFSGLAFEQGESLAFSIAAAPVLPAVPEPETYAMLLAGLGLMGAVARRKAIRTPAPALAA